MKGRGINEFTIFDLRLPIENPWRQLIGLFNRKSTIVTRKSLVLFRDRNHASVGYLADRVFELDCSVIDAKLGAQACPDIAEDTFTDRGWNVGDGDVTRERASLRAEVPDVQVVDIIDSLNFADGGFYALEFYSPGRAFEQDVQRLAHDTEA